MIATSRSGNYHELSWGQDGWQILLPILTLGASPNLGMPPMAALLNRGMKPMLERSFNSCLSHSMVQQRPTSTRMGREMQVAT